MPHAMDLLLATPTTSARLPAKNPIRIVPLLIVFALKGQRRPKVR